MVPDDGNDRLSEPTGGTVARARQGGDPGFDPSMWFDAIEQRLNLRIDAIENHVVEAIARLDMSDSTALRATVSALQLDMTAQREDVRSLESHVRQMADALSTAAQAGHEDTEALLTAIGDAAAANRPQVESEAALTRAVLERVVLRLEEMSGKVDRFEPGGGGPEGLTAAVGSVADLGPALAAIADLAQREDEGRHELADLVRVASARINVVAEELGHLGRRILEPDAGLAAVERALVELRDGLAGAGASGDGTPVSVAPVDLTPVLERLDRLSAVASPEGAVAGEAGDPGALERMEAALNDLRRRVEHQRKLSDSLAAQVSQMNAALVKASEEPQQLRRDLDRIVQQLADTVQASLRELRPAGDNAG